MYKEKLNDLMQAINSNGGSDAADDLKTLKDMCDSLRAYVDSVVAMESAIMVQRFRLDAAEYRELIERLDRGRRIEHDAALVSIRVTNRIAELYGQPHIFDCGGMDRTAIADKHILPFVNELYKERRKN